MIGGVAVASVAGLGVLAFGHTTAKPPKAPVVVLNHTLTPGAALPVTAAQVCVKGYATHVRPSASESARLKREAMARYGIAGAPASAYQGDHLISLELGGDPRSPLNWWPQPIAEAHRKDLVENQLHDAVCANQITLVQAQQCEATDWASCPARFHLLALAPVGAVLEAAATGAGLLGFALERAEVHHQPVQLVDVAGVVAAADERP